MNKKYIAGILTLLIIIIGIIYFVNSNDTNDSADTVTDQKMQGPELVSMTDGDNTIIVSDQDAGANVLINLVTLKNPGFVVIHEDQDGNPGEVVGHSQLVFGANENLLVVLDRNSEPGEMFYAMLHIDNGDGVYEFPGADVPVVDQNKNVLMVSFEIVGTSSESTDQTDDLNTKSDSETNLVIYTNDGYEPKTITIELGEKVVFRNQSSRETWPASAFHPTHTAYPGSGIDKCGTAEESDIFDACRGLENGETYEFTFSEAGEWNYHDHLRPNHFGTIIVE